MLFETAFLMKIKILLVLKIFINILQVQLYSALYLTRCGLLVLLLSLQYFLPVFMLCTHQCKYKGKGFFKLVAFTDFSAVTFAFFGIGLFIW